MQKERVLKKVHLYNNNILYFIVVQYKIILCERSRNYFRPTRRVTTYDSYPVENIMV